MHEIEIEIPLFYLKKVITCAPTELGKEKEIKRTSRSKNREISLSMVNNPHFVIKRK